MNLTPPADRVLIRQCEPETETTFGLAIPESALGQSERGIVVAAGEGAYDRNGVQHPLDVQVGDEVVLPQHGGSEVDWNGEVLVSILASQLLAVVT